ncbi:hypothetical protein [Rickettsia endosymbiont of Orchestes rusci]|uniref:hypothetical protein n=1 Tax=Rickettsia endosymbiont of Orchestes rusci TaxID=3066250 RepID=UPI00313AAC26
MLSKILFLINILIFTAQGYAAPPALPPLPVQETKNTSSTNESPQEVSTQEISTFSKIKQFFYKPKNSPAPKTIEEKNKLAGKADIPAIQEEPEKDSSLEPFIDLGDNKLPSAAESQTIDHEFKPSADPTTSTSLASNNIKSTPLPVTPNVPAPLVSEPPTTPVNAPVSPPQTIAPPQTTASSFPPTPMPIINSPVNADNVPTPPVPVNVPTLPPPAPTTDSTDKINIPSESKVVPPENTTPQNEPNLSETSPSNVQKSSSTAENWDIPLTPVKVVANPQNQSANFPLPASNKEVQQSIAKPNNEPTSDEKIITTKEKEDNAPTVTSPSATKFAKDETQMLLLPNDDIVLGKLTEQATFEQMDMYSYIKLMQKKEEWISNTDRREIVNNFIKYDNNLNKKQLIYSNLSYCDAIENAFAAIKKDNLFIVRSLLDVYPILQEKSQNGETLLTEAASNDNYYLAKFLVIRGIKISSLNSECQNASDIALTRRNNNIVCMLTKAKGW